MYVLNYVLFCSLAVLYPRVGHTMEVLSPFISVLCRFQEFQPVSVGIQEAAFDGDHTVGSLGQCVRGSRWQASHRSHRPRLICSLRHGEPWHTAPTPADRVQSDWNGAVVAPVWPQILVTVCQAQQPPVTSSQPQRRRPSRIRTGTHPVWHLLQSSGWRHSLARRTVPPVCWRLTAPSCHAHWQHIRRTLSARCMHIRQTVVHAKQSATQSWQVRSSARRNVTTAEASMTSRAICDHRVLTYWWLSKWKCSVSSWTSDWLLRSTPQLWGHAITTHSSVPGDTAHLTSFDAGLSSDACM